MWIEAIITKEDLAIALDQILPVKLHFDEDPSTDRWLYLDRATEIELVPDKGLRVACPAEVRWSVVGVDVPIKLNTLRLMITPEIVAKQHGDTLNFVIQIEEADIKGIPSLIDSTISKAVNTALAAKDLSWDFTKTLTNTVNMPKLLDPIDTLAIQVNWGKCRVNAEVLVLVVSFNLVFHRGD